MVSLTSLGEFEVHDVQAYFVEKRRIPIEQPELHAYYRICKSNPLIMGQIADILETEKWSLQR